MSDRIFIIDDNPEDVAVASKLLSPLPDIELVGEANDADSGLAAIEELQPDIVLMDLGLPGMGGHRATLRISQSWPKIAVIVVSWTADAFVVNHAFQKGAMGYVDKAFADEHLLRAVRSVASGIPWISADLRSILLADFDHLGNLPESPGERLTPRQKQILSLLAQGFETKEIAGLLGLSDRTISGHRRKIVEVLGARNTHNAVAIAARGMVDEERDGEP